ncbi:MAG: protein TolQ [Desulfatiglandales bacterium]|jgi:biopolymer transport protein TolQ|nr:protein TolQ [Desulfatiglandales bacterium]
MMNMINFPPLIFLPGAVSVERAFGNDIIQMIINAGMMVRFILLILLCLSIISWTIIFMKWRLLRKAKQETDFFLDLFWGSSDFAKIHNECRGLLFSPISHLFKSGYSELKKISRMSPLPNSMDSNTAMNPLLDSVERSLKKTTIDQGNRLEKALSFLATTGNTAPFIGLFGTVWGIMEAFRGIGMKGSASLAVVAPGISEALIATAAGLAAAIPAVIAFNYFNQKVRVLSFEMDTFTSDFLSLVERHLFKKQMDQKK